MKIIAISFPLGPIGLVDSWGAPLCETILSDAKPTDPKLMSLGRLLLLSDAQLLEGPPSCGIILT